MIKFIVSVMVLVAIVLSLTGCDNIYSEGERTGKIQKVSYKGIFVKSCEGELVTNGYKLTTTKEGDSELSNIFEFSTLNPQVCDELKKVATNNNVVTISYSQVLINKPWVANTDYRVVSVK